jgi:1-acyl-sn-glycerol-3-phosphate acyltransferase
VHKNTKTIFTYLAWLAIASHAITFLFPMLLLPEKIRFNRLFYFLLSWYSKLAVKAVFIPISVDGTIPENEQFIIVMNHASALDSVFIESILNGSPRVWMFKDVYGKIPFFGWFLKRFAVPVNREKRGTAARSLIKIIKMSKKHIAHLMIFPEGTRHFDNKIHEFKRGFVSASRKLNRRVLPILIDGTNSLFNGPVVDSLNKEIKILIGSPIKSELEESDQAFSNRTQKWFEERRNKGV